MISFMWSFWQCENLPWKYVFFSSCSEFWENEFHLEASVSFQSCSSERRGKSEDEIKKTTTIFFFLTFNTFIASKNTNESNWICQLMCYLPTEQKKTGPKITGRSSLPESNSLFWSVHASSFPSWGLTDYMRKCHRTYVQQFLGGADSTGFISSSPCMLILK